jgi:hypothetical protein
MLVFARSVQVMTSYSPLVIIFIMKRTWVSWKYGSVVQCVPSMHSSMGSVPTATTIYMDYHNLRAYHVPRTLINILDALYHTIFNIIPNLRKRGEIAR